MSKRIVLHAFALSLVVSSIGLADAAAYEAADEIVEIVRDRAAAHGVSGAYMVAVARCESRLDPDAVGAAGELGIFQLHPRGELLNFYGRGYTDPRDPWQAADFAAARFSEGAARYWSCA